MLTMLRNAPTWVNVTVNLEFASVLRDLRGRLVKGLYAQIIALTREGAFQPRHWQECRTLVSIERQMDAPQMIFAKM
jgi:hypothetical protein